MLIADSLRRLYLLLVWLLEMLMVFFLQISGDIPAVLRAVVEIGCQLRWVSVFT